MAHPSVIGSATLTFGDDTFKLKSIPSDKPSSCAAVDVTCCDDSRKQFAPGALKVNGEITVTIAGTVKPDVNDKKALSLSIGSATVNCGNAVVKSAKPSDIDAGGNREATWDVVFQPCGSDPSAT